MSDADKQSKTFDPTPRRIRQARDEGQVAKSKEVATAGVVLAGGIAILTTGESIMVAIIDGASVAFRRSSEAGQDMNATLDVFATSMGAVGMALIPFFFLIVVAATLSHVAQTGLLIAPKALLPKFERVNPFKRIKEVLGPVPALMRTAVAVLKMLFVGLVVGLVASGEIQDVQLAATRDLTSMLVRLGGAVVNIFIAAGLALSVVALIDFAYQKARHIKQLKMTREEVKRENREEEGSPELKGRRKSLYRELTLNRVLEEVPRADVVVTNPSHYAVALRYTPNHDVAPRVVAKGTDAMAMTIRRVARQNGVPIVENRRLARTLHRKVKVGRPVANELFQAVAEVLAAVYRMRQRANPTAGQRGSRR